MDFNFIDVNSKQSEGDEGDDDDDRDHFNENNSTAVDPLSMETVHPVIKEEYEELILKCEPIDYENEEDQEDSREESQSNCGAPMLPEDAAESESSIQSSVGSCLEAATKNNLEAQTASEAHAAQHMTLTSNPFETNPTSVLLENRMCQAIPESSESNAYRILPNNGPHTDNELVKSSGPASAVLDPSSQLIKIKDNMFLVVRPITSNQNSAPSTQTPALDSNQAANRKVLGLLVTNGPHPATSTSATNNLLTNQQNVTVSSSNSIQRRNLTQSIDSNKLQLLTVNGSNILVPNPTPQTDVSNLLVGNQLPKVDLSFKQPQLSISGSFSNLLAAQKSVTTSNIKSLQTGNSGQPIDGNNFKLLTVNGSNILVPNPAPQSATNLLLGNQLPKLDLGSTQSQLTIPSSVPKSVNTQPKTSPVFISFQPISRNASGLLVANGAQSAVVSSTTKTTINNVMTNKITNCMVATNSELNNSTVSTHSLSGLNSNQHFSKSIKFTVPNNQLQKSGTVSMDGSHKSGTLSQPNCNKFELLTINGSHFMIPANPTSQSSVGNVVTGNQDLSTTVRGLAAQKSFVTSTISSFSAQSPNSVPNVSPQSFLIALPSSSAPSGPVSKKSFEPSNLLKQRLLMPPSVDAAQAKNQSTGEDTGYILPTVGPPAFNSSPNLKQPVISLIASTSDASTSLSNNDQQKIFVAATTLLDSKRDENEVFVVDDYVTPSSRPNNDGMEKSSANKPVDESVQNSGSHTINMNENPGTKCLFFIDNNGKLNIGTKSDTEESSRSCPVQNITGSNGKLNQSSPAEFSVQNSFGNNGKLNLLMNLNTLMLPNFSLQQSSTISSLEKPTTHTMLKCSMCFFKLPNKKQLKIHELVYHEVPYVCECGEKIMFYQSFAKHNCPYNDVSLDDVKKAILNSKFIKLKSVVDSNKDGKTRNKNGKIRNKDGKSAIVDQSIEDKKIIEADVSVEGDNQDTEMLEDVPCKVDVNQDLESEIAGVSMETSDDNQYITDLVCDVDGDSVDPLADASDNDEPAMLAPEVILGDESAVERRIEALMMAVKGNGRRGNGRKRKTSVEESESTVSCPLCKQRVKNLEEHILEKHKFVCGVCDKEFNRKSNLLTHLAVHSDRRDFACKLCDKTYKTKAGLYIHERSHAIQRRPSCEYCSKTFLLTTHLQTHVFKHHADVARKYKCDMCDEEFVIRRLWMRHKNRHKEEGILCMVCGRRFVSEEELKQHSSVHTKQDLNHDFCCDLCGRTFRELHFLTAHRNAHARKNNQCKHCKKRFKNDAELKSHMLTHKGYKCKECDKVFTKNTHLKEHSKEHVKRSIKCDVCDQWFLTDIALRLHVSKVHNLKQNVCENRRIFECEFCGKTYITRSKMLTHKVTHADYYIPLYNRSPTKDTELIDIQNEQPESSSVS